MNKRKVLIVIHQLNIGGVQKSVIPVLDAIDYSKNDVTLYVRKDRTDLLPLINKNVSKIIINKDKTKYYRKPYIIWLQIKLKLTEMFGKDNTKVKEAINNYIINSQMIFEKNNYFCDNYEYDVAVSLIQDYTAKFVADFVNAKRKIMFFRGSEDFLHNVHEGIMKYFSKIYCVSEGSKLALARFYPQYADKMDVIDSFVSAESIIKESKEYSVDKHKLTLVSCGRIMPVKGFDLAVEAAKELRDCGIDFVWYFVGDGDEKENIKKIIELYDLNENIVITGLKNNPYPYIAASDIYVQPSYAESFGRTIKEALILKKPVVSTSTVGATDQIHNLKNGILTEISAQGIAEGIKSLISNTDLCNAIVNEISNIDYSKEMDEYKKKWDKLLEGE